MVLTATACSGGSTDGAATSVSIETALPSTGASGEPSSTLDMEPSESRRSPTASVGQDEPRDPPIEPGAVTEPNRVDVIVAGDGLGAVAAAIQAGRRGHDVVVLSPTGYVGGQAGSAAVTSFDDASGPARTLLRSSGIYAEFFNRVTARYAEAGIEVSHCYFSSTNTFCPEPLVVRDVLEEMLSEAGVVISTDRVERIERRGIQVEGVVTRHGRHYVGVVIDGTEFGDVIALAAAEYGVGNHGSGSCVQDLTHAAVMAWYPSVPPELVVPEAALQMVASEVGADVAQTWLEEFRARVRPGGQADFNGWAELTYPLDPSLADWYRGMADSRPLEDPTAPPITLTGVNLANDTAVPAAAVRDEGARMEVFRRAMLKTYLYMWYDRWELGRDQWAVASHLEFSRAERSLWLGAIPDEIERHLPPAFYVREARRLVGPVLEGAAIVERGTDVFPDSVFIAGDRSDADHGGCAITDSIINPDLGAYDAPLGVFIPADVDGLAVAIARNGRVDRSAASSIRMHAPEFLGGQAVGMLVALAVETNSQLRDVPAARVRDELVAVGAVVDVP